MMTAKIQGANRREPDAGEKEKVSAIARPVAGWMRCQLRHATETVISYA